MKLVQFPNGEFGVRRGLFFHEFLDLKNPNFWRTPGGTYYQDCMGSEERARKAAKLYWPPKVVPW